ncbi:Piwi domain-containing protein [Flavobacterium marginilacus]|uniref:Piwi domain-containing protein n=1 Tax=Flavobacterium marginilacus TaxID=3003256 RepID=UPI00248EE189|nr:Piwi domain-containing protein [Flavobacterium marginilacus]
MSGLFLNFYQVDIPTKAVSIDSIEYSKHSSKEAFIALKDNFPNLFFYRDDDKFLIWKNTNEAELPENVNSINIDFSEKPKILSKIFERSIIDFIEPKGYKIFKNKHSNSWEIISSKDILKGSIEGLIVNRIVNFSPCFFFKESKLLLGFSLSTSLKNSFTWSKAEFEKHGIDIKGLRGDEERIYANRQSLKRFLETKGATSKYDQIINDENRNAKVFSVIDSFYKWLEKNKAEIQLPYGLVINSISKKYLPFEDDLIKSEIINKPQRYFYSNRKNTQGLQYYDQMVKAYQPYSLELYQNKQINIGIICPSEYQGETEGFVKKTEAKLKEVFHFNSLNVHFKTITNKDLESYKEVLYDETLLKCDLVYVIVNEAQEKLSPSNSPYYVCKAKFIGNGIPTQDIQIETIRQNLNAFTMTNIALNSYAKLGGTAWTIEKEEKLKDELVIGIGSTLSESGQFVLGIAQVFHNDGRYMTGDCSPLSSFDNYAENLENHLFKTLQPLVEEMSKSGTFRLIFHLFKSASEEYEIKAINRLKERFTNFNFEFALVHLAYGHNFRLYNNDGNNDIKQGTYIQLSKYSALLHFVGKSDLPLKIDLDKRSTFTSLFYLAKQVYWFSHLSHRSYMPSKRTVTIMYPSLMAKMTEELKKVEGWDYERLKAVSEKLWFI